MKSILSKLVLFVAITGLLTTEAMAAKGSSSSSTRVEDSTKAEKEAEKSAKDAAKLLEKSQKDAQKKADRIELLAKMKAAESVDDDVEEEVPEDEASLKYRSRDSRIRLTAEVEGFNDGDVFNMYVVINNAEVLVAKLELVGAAGEIPRQEIEFDDATWPTGVPKVLTEGTIVRLRDAQGKLIFESTLQPK